MKPSKSKDLKISARTCKEVVATAVPPRQFIPWGDRLSVKPIAKKERFVDIGGVMADTTVEMFGYGETEILEVGPGCISAQKGDRIVCNVEAVREIKVGTDTFFMIQEMAVVGRIRDIQQKTPPSVD